MKADETQPNIFAWKCKVYVEKTSFSLSQDYIMAWKTARVICMSLPLGPTPAKCHGNQ